MKRLFSYVYFEILNSRADSALDSVEFLCFFSVLLLCDFACDECELLGQTWNCYDFYFSEQLLDLTLALCGVAGHADEEAALYIIDLLLLVIRKNNCRFLLLILRLLCRMICPHVLYILHSRK